MESKQIKTMIVAQETLRNEIDELAAAKGLWTDDVGPIRDGVADIEAYIQSSPKVMWVLKEPYDDFKEDGSPYGGDYTLMEDLKKNRNAQLGTMPLTDRRVIYATYGIFAGYEYDDMGWYYEPETYKYLFQIAYINLSKMPGGKKSGDMTTKFQTWRDIVLKQINLYNPNVIIFGGTFQYLKDDLGIDNTYKVHTEEDWKLNIDNQNNTLFVDTYHPGIPGWDRMYINKIAKNIRKILKL